MDGVLVLFVDFDAQCWMFLLMVIEWGLFVGQPQSYVDATSITRMGR